MSELKIGNCDRTIQHIQPNWLCPDIRPHWQLAQHRASGQLVLSSLYTSAQHSLSHHEAYALRYFTGQFTVRQVQKACQRQLKLDAQSALVIDLINKLIDWNVISSDGSNQDSSVLPANPAPIAKPQAQNLSFKSAVHWIEHPDGYWILRNTENMTFMQVDVLTKQVIDALANTSPAAVIREYNLEPAELRSLLQQLVVTAMLEGTEPPQPPKRKFKPTQLLFFKFSLCNPDSWLEQTLPSIRWMWSRWFTSFLLVFLSVCLVIGFDQADGILATGMELWQAMGASVFIPFGLLSMLVVTIHEFGHAYTLKYYGGIVPEIGLMFMFFMPAAYTNTTDQYMLSRRQRILVVGAGVLSQFTIAGVAICLWNFSVPGSWLSTASYLLLAASLFTVALNLNPLAKFDGYYFAIALSGINNLRTRSFLIYKQLFQRQILQEKMCDRWILFLYAPLSFIYLLLVFGKLFTWLVGWSLMNIPMIAICLVILWGIYYFFPDDSSPTISSH